MGKRKKLKLLRMKGEVLRDAREEARIEQRWHIVGDAKPPRRPKKGYRYVDELARLQFELLKLQEWVRLEGLRVVVVFEGRDAAGKGGVIKRITESLNPRFCRIVALGTPTEKERGQWYFQRYVEQLPARGEIVLFDRSWYNRAGVERVMGFCTEDEYKEFLRSCPLFEEMLVRSGIHLIKYWFSVNDEEQERRFLDRMRNPIKRWKLSPMDIESRERWVEYSRAKDVMLKHIDRKLTPWHIVNADTKKRAAQLHRASAAPDPLQGSAADRGRSAAAPARHRLRASAQILAALGPRRLLSAIARISHTGTCCNPEGRRSLAPGGVAATLTMRASPRVTAPALAAKTPSQRMTV